MVRQHKRQMRGPSTNNPRPNLLERYHSIHIMMPSIPRVEYDAAILPALNRIQWMAIKNNVERAQIEKQAERFIRQINEFYGRGVRERGTAQLKRARDGLIKLSLKYPEMERRL